MGRKDAELLLGEALVVIDIIQAAGVNIRAVKVNQAEGLNADKRLSLNLLASWTGSPSP